MVPLTSRRARPRCRASEIAADAVRMRFVSCSRRTARRRGIGRHGRCSPAARGAAAWCAASDVDKADVALHFALAGAPVDSTLVGMRTREEVLASVRALDAAPDARALARVQALLSPVQDIDWPSGLSEAEDLSDERADSVVGS
jgi:hypothetical protein